MGNSSPLFKGLGWRPHSQYDDDRSLRRYRQYSDDTLAIQLREEHEKRFRLLRRHPELIDAVIGSSHPQQPTLQKIDRRIRLLSQVQAERIDTEAETAANSNSSGLVPAIPQAASLATPGAKRRRYGPKPDSEGHERVAAIVSKFGEGWQEHLEEICHSLDSAGVSVSRDWKKKHIPTWFDAWADSTENTVKAIEYRLEKASAARTNSR
jgi:hypothetical protein